MDDRMKSDGKILTKITQLQDKYICQGSQKYTNVEARARVAQ
jgi:hypothetical protein